MSKVETPLQRVHLLQFDTYRRTPAATAGLRSWRQRPGRDGVLIDDIHDCHAVLRYAILDEPLAPAEALAHWTAFGREAPDGCDGHCGATRVLLAPCESEHWSDAAACLFESLGDGRGGVRGGALLPGVGLFAGGDPAALVVLCEPRAERTACDFLYGGFRLLEMMRHKVAYQEGAYRRQAGALRDQQDRLRAELEPLEGILTAEAEDTPARLAEALAQQTRMIAAYRVVGRTTCHARQMRTTLRANLANLRRYLAEVPPGPGKSVLLGRARQARLAVAQIEADLEYGRPLLESARWLSRFHHTRLLTALSLSEMKETALREQSSAEQRRFERSLTALAIWVSASQIWAAAVANWLAPQQPLAALLGWMFLPPALGIGSFVALRRLRKLLRKEGRP
jgi:hypothetical protein